MPITRHRVWQLLADAGMIALAWYLAFQLRFDFEVRQPFYQEMLRETILFVVAIKLAVFVAFGFYQRWWRYVSTRDMWRVLIGVGVASVLDHPARIRPKVVPGVWAASPPGAVTSIGVPTLE